MIMLSMGIASMTAQIASPNGALTVKTKGHGLVVNYQNQPVLEMPSVGMESKSLKLKFSQKITADYRMLAGKRLHCTNEANEYQAPIGKNATVVMRLYNDGIAFRYEYTGLQDNKVPAEKTAYKIPEGTKRWMLQWSDGYEGFFPMSTTANVKTLGGFGGSMVQDAFNTHWGYPLLMEPADGVFALITEANIERRQSASSLFNKGEVFNVVQDQNELLLTGDWHTPWRVVIIGSLADIVQSTLVTDVSESSKLEDTSWIKPGVVSWVYWAYNHGSNDFNIIKKYVDMAVALHLPYVLIDAEWDEMDKLASNEGKTINDAVAYANAKGIKPLIWYNSSVGWVNGAPGPKFRLNKPEDREKEFAWCEKIGVAGVKIDFFSGDNQANMDYCQDLMESAARHHLLVNFHGAPIPRGWQRTYPNLLSTEGVYGAEWYNNVPTFTKKAASHNATLPFTRNVIGPMDYTPCAFSDSQHPHITSNAHELALTVLFESGLQHLADRPESFLAQPQQVQQFLGNLPAAWDETRFVSGYPGESAVLARRSGDRWYIAGINGRDEAQTLQLPLGFLPKGRITLFADGTPWSITRPATLPSEMVCQPRGGFVMVVEPEPKLTVRYVAPNAVRIQYGVPGTTSPLPDWLYVKHDEVKTSDISATVEGDAVTVKDKTGHVVFRATSHELEYGTATLSFDSPKDEFLYGLGQFQDGYSNVHGLSRRLTQVNTQISIPMLLSSKGYGVLWNNYGLTEFNPCDKSVVLKPQASDPKSQTTEVVNVTSTEGGKKEVRQRNIFEATVEVAEAGDYTLLLDVGQKMARRHNLAIDDKTVIDMQNLWLPPTASAIVHLEAGRHTVTAELSRGDQPVLYYNKVGDQTVFRSPVADAVDYTVFVGSPDEIIATYRDLTGECPQMPRWALGYIHCRERFHSSEEILQTANRFRKEKMPVDVLVQDWQYWGKYGWNSMRFDEDHYPDPKALTDSLHRMGMRLMLSVWSKIDKNSDVGRQMTADNYYIPGTDWIDFFNPKAAAAYWKNFSERLVPLGIDAWWQDATEPENDDLVGRRVNDGRWAGEQVRNVYPLLVCKTVYEGLAPLSAPEGAVGGASPFILTRSGFPGIQRYGVALWSGDVGNDWETFRRQLTGGLGMQAAGIPWWTYDAGGFFRPGDQYTNKDYIERMLRWIETAVYLPLMRVHGYMSNTEPWNYGPEAKTIIANCLKERYKLLPYIENCAKAVSEQGGTLMRPLVFDFANDPEALKQKYEYMFGPALLVNPVTEPGVTTWRTYLPQHPGGWYDYRTGKLYDGGQYITTAVTKAYIPVFLRAGYKLPTNSK